MYCIHPYIHRQYIHTFTGCLLISERAVSLWLSTKNFFEHVITHHIACKVIHSSNNSFKMQKLALSDNIMLRRFSLIASLKRETENCALKLTIFYLGTSFRGLLLTSSSAMESLFHCT